ncbi:MAG TPA: hypothetical protein VK941_01480, partial [Gillisia sp.]|nr:hypothetical protein [Gillisia sp.]
MKKNYFFKTIIICLLTIIGFECHALNFNEIITIPCSPVIVEGSSEVNTLGYEEPFYAGGTGTESDPFQISDWEHLHNVRENISSFFILNNNLDQASPGYETYASSSANDNEGWLPIGDNLIRFSGKFDGNYHTIKGLTINRSSTDNIGLFGVSFNLDIKNVGLIDVSITGRTIVGGLTGFINGKSAKISEVFVTGTVTGVSEVGGLIGQSGGIRISNSYTDVAVEASISSFPRAGGFIGFS